MTLLVIGIVSLQDAKKDAIADDLNARRVTLYPVNGSSLQLERVGWGQDREVERSQLLLDEKGRPWRNAKASSHPFPRPIPQ